MSDLEQAVERVIDAVVDEQPRYSLRLPDVVVGESLSHDQVWRCPDGREGGDFPLPSP